MFVLILHTLEKFVLTLLDLCVVLTACVAKIFKLNKKLPSCFSDSTQFESLDTAPKQSSFRLQLRVPQKEAQAKYCQLHI